MVKLHEKFVSQMSSLLSESDCSQLMSIIRDAQPQVSVRVNPAKHPQLPTSLSRVPWCPTGFCLDSRPQFTFDPFLHAGHYYVQDASSMFLHHVICSLISEPVRYLDLCAAPGGKTTTALSALPHGSLVVANEYVTQRARVLADNVMRWGASNCVVTNNTPRDLGRLKDFFHVIAADVPCSGEGMFRKDADAVAQWSPALVEECAARQKQIIADVWDALRPGGLFIYSTCTYNSAENEQMVDYIVRNYNAESVPVPVSEEWNILPAIASPHHCYRFMPHRTRGEGLFLSVVRKPGGEKVVDQRLKGSLPPVSPALAKSIAGWMATDVSFMSIGDDIVALPDSLREQMAFLCGRLNVFYCGTPVASIKGKRPQPLQSLALSCCINRDAFDVADVDYPTALAYLRGESLNIPVPKGYVLLTYNGASLGFVNNLGNRANNLYPKPLRIISRNAPQLAPQLLI